MMHFLAELLLFLGDVALDAWGYASAAVLGIARLIDALLNPILSPVLAWINPICVRLGDVCFAVLSFVPAAWGITLLSALLGVAMLFVFRHLSNQTAIARAKDDIKAHLLAMRLFRDDLRIVFHSQMRLVMATLRLQRCMLAPILWSLAPMLLILAQMGLRYQWRPLRVGERTVVKLRTAPDRATIDGVILSASDAVDVEVGPVPGGGEWVWRIRAVKEGRHALHFRTTGAAVAEFSKDLVVSDAPDRVSAQRPGTHWFDRLLHPVEPPLPSDSPFVNIELVYPSVNSYVCGADYWVAYFFIVSMVTALILAPFLRVRF